MTDAAPEAPRPPPTPLTFLIAAVNVAVFFWAEAVGSTTNSETLVRFGALERGMLWEGEYWRLVTPMFLHIGPIHLILNTYFIFGLCRVVERLFGTWRLAVAYLACGVAGSAVSAISHWGVSAGASGAAFGLFGMLLVVVRVNSRGWKDFFSKDFVRMNLLIFAGLTAMGFTLLKFDNWAHFGGLGFGVVVAVAFLRRWRVPATVAAVVLWASLIGASVRPWFGQDTIESGRFSWRLGNREFERDRFAEALEHYDRAERLGMPDAELFYNRGLAREHLGDAAGAAADFRRVAETAPEGGDLRAKARRKLGGSEEPPGS